MRRQINNWKITQFLFLILRSNWNKTFKNNLCKYRILFLNWAHKNKILSFINQQNSILIIMIIKKIEFKIYYKIKASPIRKSIKIVQCKHS